MSDGARLPYPGLRAFSRDEADLFFGRETCVDAMVDRLAAKRFLAVLGPSGSGKSSLVRTGLFDALELGLHAKAGAQWLIIDTHPGGQPTRNLAAALIETSAPGDQIGLDIESLASFLARGPRSLIEWCRDGHLAPHVNLLVLIDQFEELFRYKDYGEREEAQAFVALLLESSCAPDVPINIVITMRSEYIGACALLPGLAERINEGLYLTPRMTREQCRTAIEGPAKVVGLTVEPALVNRILNDMARFAPWQGEAGGDQLQNVSRLADQLPLMQHVLNKLSLSAADRDGSKVLRLAAYEGVGGLAGALDAHAGEVLDSLSPEQKSVAAVVFRGLVSGTSLQDAVRRPCRFGDLVRYAGGDRDNVAAVVEAFRAPGCNFLRPSRPEPLNNGTVVDISHESLIRQWSALSKWFEIEVVAAKYWRRLLDVMDSHGRDKGDLMGGRDLKVTEERWARENPNAARVERYGGRYQDAKHFLDQSIEAERQRVEAERRREEADRQRAEAEQRRIEADRSRQVRSIVAIAVVLAVLAGGLAIGVWQFKAQRNAAVAAKRSAEDAYASAAKVSDDFLTGIGRRVVYAADVPSDDLEPIFKQAGQFLERFPKSTNVVVKSAVSHAKAIVSLTFAEIESRREHYQSMRKHAEDARATLVEGANESNLPSGFRRLLATVYLVQGRAYFGEHRYGEASGRFLAAKNILQNLNEPWPDASPRILPGLIHYWTSANERALGHRDAAVDEAKQCVEAFKRIEEKKREAAKITGSGEVRRIYDVIRSFSGKCQGIINDPVAGTTGPK